MGESSRGQPARVKPPREKSQIEKTVITKSKGAGEGEKIEESGAIRRLGASPSIVPLGVSVGGEGKEKRSHTPGEKRTLCFESDIFKPVKGELRAPGVEGRERSLRDLQMKK